MGTLRSSPAAFAIFWTVLAVLVVAPEDAVAQPVTSESTEARAGDADQGADAQEPAPKADAQEPARKDEAEAPPPTDPLGFAGESPIAPIPRLPPAVDRPAVAVPDRWRIGWPRWDRYGRMADNDSLFMSNVGGDSPYTRGDPLNPYDRNVLKGDYPVLGDDVFLNATLISDTFFNFRRLPTISGVSAAGSGAFDFFGDGKQLFLSQSVFASVDLFKGYSAFRPVDWLARVTGAFNYNRLELRENNATEIDVRAGDLRQDEFVTLQEAFFEYHLGDLSPEFDIAAVRAGRQLFVSDFRGFVFNDVADGVRLLGNLDSNRVQYNLAYLNRVEKDTNSELAELNWRDEQILIANLYVQDFIWPGYTTQLSFHWNHDQSDNRFDTNGFLVRPDLAGSVTPHDIDAYYVGWTGDGHIGRLNVDHAFYYVFGDDSANPIAGRDVDIDAYLGAVELSVDIDWFRPKVSLLRTSGDDDPTDGRAEGFDGINDNPFFAGGPGSLYQSSAFRVFGVDLVSAKSLYFDLAGTKIEGQSNFVNPGTMILNAGFDMEITPKLRASFNYNRIWFVETGTLELFLNQNDVDDHFGDEFNLLFQYRPALNNNIILTSGGSLFLPGDGFSDIFDSNQDLYQLFVGVTLTY